MNACAAVVCVSICSIIGRGYDRAAARIGGQAAGRGARRPAAAQQSAPSPLGRCAAGGAVSHFPPKRKKGRPRSGGATGAKPRPQLAKRAGNLGDVRRPAGATGGANSDTEGKRHAGCPPAGTARRGKGGGGRPPGVPPGAQPEPRGSRTATPKASGTRVARPLEPPCGVRGWGRGIKRGWRASSPKRWRVALATEEPPTPSAHG